MTCDICGLPDPYRGDGDGIGSCDCPRCDCGTPRGSYLCICAPDDDALDADDYPPDYDLDLCQPADTTLPPVAPYGRRRDDVTTVHLPAHDIA